MFSGHLQMGGRRHTDFGIKGRGAHRYRRLQTEAAARNQADVHAHAGGLGQGGCAMVAVAGRPLLLSLRQRQPDLQAMQQRASGTCLGRRTFYMGDRCTGAHPADITCADTLVRAQAVTVLQFTAEQVRQGGQADVRVSSNVQPVSGGVAMFEHVIEEHERSDAAAAGRG